MHRDKDGKIVMDKFVEINNEQEIKDKNVIATILKDSIENSNDISSSPFVKNKKPKYLQSNSKSKRNTISLLNSSNKNNISHEGHKLNPEKSKKRRVKFKDSFIDWVDIESFKIYNLKMCFSEYEGMLNDSKKNSCEEACSFFKNKCSIF